MNIDKSFIERKRGTGKEYSPIGTTLRRSDLLHFLIYQCSTNHSIPCPLRQSHPSKNHLIPGDLFCPENINPFIPGQRLPRTGNV